MNARIAAMRLTAFTTVALAASLAACGGGGGSGAPVAPINATPAPSPTPTPRPSGSVTPSPAPTASPTPGATATPTAVPTATPTPAASLAISVIVPNPGGASSSVGRRPQYVSFGTRAVSLYDGATAVYVANVVPGTPPSFSTVFASTGPTVVTGGSCNNTAPTATCTFTLTTTPGAHAFDLVTFSSQQTNTTPAGAILSEGEVAVTLVPGPNPGQTVTPLGVAASAQITPPVLTAHLNGNGPAVGIIGTTYTFQYVINDATFNQIVQPGNYDNGPVTITETDGGGIVTMTPVSQTAPPASAGPQTFTVTCAQNGTATLTASAGTHPSAAYASGLTYTSTNYSSGTLGTSTLQCVPNSATLPVTVQ